MRHTDTLTKASIMANSTFAFALVITAVLASAQAFGSNVLSKTWAKVLVLCGLVGAVYLGTSRDFYLPFLGPNMVPSSLLKVSTPPDATVAIAVDAPQGATHVMYWAARTSLTTSGDPQTAYGDFTNAGVVPVAGGRATLRLACPGTYQAMRRTLPRHLHYRYVFTNGLVSSVKTLPVTCP